MEYANIAKSAKAVLAKHADVLAGKLPKGPGTADDALFGLARDTKKLAKMPFMDVLSIEDVTAQLHLSDLIGAVRASYIRDGAIKTIQGSYMALVRQGIDDVHRLATQAETTGGRAAAWDAMAAVGGW